MSKSRVLGLLLILGVGFLVLRPGDETSDTRESTGGSKSSTDQQFQPREPAFGDPSPDYGIAGQAGTQETAPSYASPARYPQQPYPRNQLEGYPAAYATSDPYGGQARIPTHGYKFRPLNDKEQKRAQTRIPEQYQPPTYSAPAARYHPPAPPSPYSAPAAPRSPQQEVYSFRPLEKSRASRGRWQGPYQQPDWRDDRYPLDPWTAPPDPQWGSTPPSQRMYPSYYRETSRRITAR